MKILIVAPAWIGDMVMAHALFRCLQQRDSTVILDVLAVDWCLPIVERMPEVRRALSMPIGHGKLQLRLRKEIGTQLRTEQYQQAIIMGNSWKSALIPWFAKIPQRTGWRGEWRYGLLNDIRQLDPQRYPMQIQRYAALAYPAATAFDNTTGTDKVPWPQLSSNTEAIERTKIKFRIPHQSEPIALAPGAAKSIEKCWPPRHYASLAEQLLQQGHWVLLLGAAHDRIVCDIIQQQLPDSLKPRCLNLAGQSSLIEVIDLIACCQAVISNDSGLMHIASALDKAVIALFGPTDPAHTPALTSRRRILRGAMPANSVHSDPRDKHYHPRLISLSPQQVFSALQDLLTIETSSCIS